MTKQVRPEAGALFDLTDRAKFRVSGADRVRFLNGQITNDVRKATAELAIQACVLNVKGKINANVFIAADSESFLIDSDPEERETLPARLERYIIADDVQIEDVTDEFALLHATGNNSVAASAPSRTVKANRFATAGSDFWLARADHNDAVREIARILPLLDDAAREVLRIELGIPRWGRELTDEIIPIEANLEESTVDYAKGCYIGQEVISRIKMSGQTNKRLCGLIALSAAAIEPGMRLFASASEPKDAGWVTSVCRSERLQATIALGFVKRGFQAPGTELHAVREGSTGDAVTLKIVPLPFA